MALEVFPPDLLLAVVEALNPHTVALLLNVVLKIQDLDFHSAMTALNFFVLTLPLMKFQLFPCKAFLTMLAFHWVEFAIISSVLG